MPLGTWCPHLDSDFTGSRCGKNDAENKKKVKKKSPGEICEMALSWVEGGAGIQRERERERERNVKPHAGLLEALCWYESY